MDLHQLVGKSVKLLDGKSAVIIGAKERPNFSEPELGLYNVDVWFDRAVNTLGGGLNYSSLAYDSVVARQIGKIMGCHGQPSEAGMQGDKKPEKQHANFDLTAAKNLKVVSPPRLLPNLPAEPQTGGLTKVELSLFRYPDDGPVLNTVADVRADLASHQLTLVSASLVNMKREYDVVATGQLSAVEAYLKVAYGDDWESAVEDGTIQIENMSTESEAKALVSNLLG